MGDCGGDCGGGGGGGGFGGFTGGYRSRASSNSDIGLNAAGCAVIAICTGILIFIPACLFIWLWVRFESDSKWAAMGFVFMFLSLLMIVLGSYYLYKRKKNAGSQQEVRTGNRTGVQEVTSRIALPDVSGTAHTNAAQPLSVVAPSYPARTSIPTGGQPTPPRPILPTDDQPPSYHDLYPSAQQQELDTFSKI